jgi:hypothetical protein
MSVEPNSESECLQAKNERCPPETPAPQQCDSLNLAPLDQVRNSASPASHGCVRGTRKQMRTPREKRSRLICSPQPCKTVALGSMRGYRAKERPRCRLAIINHELRPFIDERDGVWNGFQALRSNGKRTFLSDGMRKQMGRMLREGYWVEMLDCELNRRAQESRSRLRRLREFNEWDL